MGTGDAVGAFAPPVQKSQGSRTCQGRTRREVELGVGPNIVVIVTSKEPERLLASSILKRKRKIMHPSLAHEISCASSLCIRILATERAKHQQLMETQIMMKSGIHDCPEEEIRHIIVLFLSISFHS